MSNKSLDFDKLLFELSNTPKAKPCDENQLWLPNGKLITFNEQQFEGIKKIRKWLVSNKTFFTLAGYAGTGKSTVIKKIIDEFRGRIAVSAPTHKAKKVITNTTGKDGITLHSMLGLRPDLNLDDFNPNDPKFNQLAKPKIADYKFIVIDEASMINKELYELIKETVEGTRIKILFMGDPAQIPPVGEKDSIIFSSDENEMHWLTKIERQNDSNPLSFIYDALRNNLNRIDGGYVKTTNINANGEGVIFTKDKMEFRNAILEKYLSDEYKKDTDFAKVIAWKNDTVMASNKVIRAALLGEKTDIVEVNDILMGYRSIMDETQRYNIIENSADYRVVEKSGLEENNYNISGYQIKLRENINHNEFKFVDIFVVDHSNHKNLHAYAEMHDFLKDISKSNKKMWGKYYDFRRNNVLLTTIDKFENGGFRGGWDTIAKDLDFGYAITGHKSQGSTYNHVFVLEDDMDENWLIKERNQIKYVALTRPTTSAVVLTHKAGK